MTFFTLLLSFFDAVSIALVSQMRDGVKELEKEEEEKVRVLPRVIQPEIQSLALKSALLFYQADN